MVGRLGDDGAAITTALYLTINLDAIVSRAGAASAVRIFVGGVAIAHMVAFWSSEDSNVTPPVCLAAYAAAGIAGSDPMRTGLHAWKYAKGLYLIPLLLLEGVMAMLALAAIAAALEGYALRPLALPGRGVLLAAGALAFFPSLTPWGVGCAVAFTYVLWQQRTAGDVLAA